MAGELIYAFRVMRLPLLDAGGNAIGRLDDVVVIPGRSGAAPRVLGFVATSQRRRIFVNAGRLGSLDADGARLRSWDVDLNPFKPRAGEILLGRDVIDARIGDETVSDVALRPGGDGRETWWEIGKVRLARRTALRRRPSYRLLDYDEVPQLFAMGAGSEMVGYEWKVQKRNGDNLWLYKPLNLELYGIDKLDSLRKLIAINPFLRASFNEGNVLSQSLTLYRSVSNPNNKNKSHFIRLGVEEAGGLIRDDT